jgi:hypothetical protein
MKGSYHMPLYRVFGTKYKNYYTIVSAADEYQAAEIANLRPETDWNDIPTDDVIEATDVFLDEDTEIDLKLNI